MAIDVLAFGHKIQETVAPALDLFATDGFAPLLALVMLVFAIGLSIEIYMHHIRPGKASLRKGLRTVSNIKNQENFREQFNEIDDALQSTPLLKHGWTEFRETFIMPETSGGIQVIRNTIRPGVYLNAHEVETALGLRRLHFVSNLLVGIGLLLTFIGLVAALKEAGAGIASGSTDFQEPIKKLLTVAAFKFWTSVAGLASSIGIRIFYEFHHNSIKKILASINENIERGLQFVTPERLAVEHLHAAEQQSAAMRRFTQELAVSLADKIQTGFDSAMLPVSESLKDIGNRITGGIGDAIKDAAGNEMQQLAQNLGGIVQSLNTSRSEMDGIGATLRAALTETIDTLKSASGDAARDMSQQLQNAISMMAEESLRQTQKLDESMERLSAIMDQAGAQAGAQVTQAASTLASGMNGVSDGIRGAADAMADRMDNVSTTLQAIDERMQTYVTAMSSLTGRAQDTEKAMGATSRHLSEAALPVTQASNKMAAATEQLQRSMLTMQSAVGESHQGLVALAGKIGETQKALQSAWQSYDRRFANVDESLAKALQGIVNNVRDNVQSMEKFVKEIDQRFGKAVETFGNSISDLSETMEGFEEAVTREKEKIAA